MLHRTIVDRPEFVDRSSEAMAYMGALICDAKCTSEAFSLAEYGTFFGDPSIALAATYSALKNDISIHDACILTLAFHCHLKTKRIKGSGFIAYMLSSGKQEEVKDLERIASRIDPHLDSIHKRVNFDQFLDDAAEYLRQC